MFTFVLKWRDFLYLWRNRTRWTIEITNGTWSVDYLGLFRGKERAEREAQKIMRAVMAHPGPDVDDVDAVKIYVRPVHTRYDDQLSDWVSRTAPFEVRSLGRLHDGVVFWVMVLVAFALSAAVSMVLTAVLLRTFGANHAAGATLVLAGWTTLGGILGGCGSMPLIAYVLRVTH